MSSRVALLAQLKPKKLAMKFSADFTMRYCVVVRVMMLVEVLHKRPYW
jgi:hypothetical protein